MTFSEQILSSEKSTYFVSKSYVDKGRIFYIASDTMSAVNASLNTVTWKIVQ